MALTILISVILLGLCMAGLALNILVKKNGQFPQTEIGQNPYMRKMGISCVKEDECAACSRSNACATNTITN